MGRAIYARLILSVLLTALAVWPSITYAEGENPFYAIYADIEATRKFLDVSATINGEPVVPNEPVQVTLGEPVVLHASYTTNPPDVYAPYLDIPLDFEAVRTSARMQLAVSQPGIPGAAGYNMIADLGYGGSELTVSYNFVEPGHYFMVFVPAYFPPSVFVPGLGPGELCGGVWDANCDLPDPNFQRFLDLLSRGIELSGNVPRTGDIPPMMYGILEFDVIESNPEPTCCSSVLFLPGIEGSRLYEGPERRWEADDDADVVALYLDDEGKSENSTIAIGNVIETFDGVLDVDIYKLLLQKLAGLKSRGVIENYVAVPYDWRLSLTDILADRSIEDTLRALAEDSKTEKVTIVAHSNGGLLTKALLNQLGPEASDLVDKLIFVGVPQLGTPQALGALLHGFDANIPPAFSRERARDFGLNASMTYQLLPHADYYDNPGFEVDTPLVMFEPGAATAGLIARYDSTVDSANELIDFLNAVDGRDTPAFDNLESPAIANPTLLVAANELMGDIGSSWEAPEGIEVHQIAGIGENTLSGLTYKTLQECAQTLIVAGSEPVCLRYTWKLSYSPNEVIDGDGTVVVPSALAMSTNTENVKRWWVDLDDYHSEHFLEQGPFRKDHKNLLEIPEILSIIVDNFVTQESNVIPTYLSEFAPTFEEENRLRFVLHSPLSLSILDLEGNVVSETLAEIPDATFKRYGEVQVISVPSDAHPTVQLSGVSDGSFTLEVEEYDGEELVASADFSGIPSLATTEASMNFLDGTIENAGNLEIDYDGNESIDVTLAPEIGETVTLPKIPLIVAANSVTVTLGDAIPPVSYTVSGFVGGETLATSDITGTPACTTDATASAVGTYPIICELGTLTSDVYSFAFVPGTLSVMYRFDGFLQPINDTAHQIGQSLSVFKAGSTVPVKLQLKRVDGTAVQGGALPLWLGYQKGSVMSAAVDESVYTNPQTTGTSFVWDATTQQHQYNWSTKGIQAGYWYRIFVKLDDGKTYSVTIGLR